MSYIASHREDFECFLGEDFDHYCRNMAASGTWGDELTLVRGIGGVGAGQGRLVGTVRVTAWQHYVATTLIWRGLN